LTLVREQRKRPTAADLAAARGRGVSDVLAPGLRVVFCGINPSLYSAAVGHHFARPGNRFWPALHGAGFTDRLLSPYEDGELLRYRLGCTNLVERATARADELDAEELRHGAESLAAMARRLRPQWLAVLGISAYRAAFGRPGAPAGRQPERLAGAPVWVLPNPSGLNAHYRLLDLIDAYRQLNDVVNAPT
jgi:TDG/mug DNA glycosylase family protein